MSKVDYQDILRNLQKEVAENPRYADYRYRLALFEMFFGNYSKAMEEITQCLSLNPNYSQAKELDKIIRIMQGQKITEPGRMENPPFCIGEAHQLAALYFAQQDRMDLAEKALLDAFAISYDENQYELQYGLLAEARGDLTKAVEHLKRALALDSPSWKPYFVLSQIYAIQDNMTEAGEILKQAAERFPTFSDLQYHLGIFLLGKGEFKESAVYLEKAIRINPNFIFAHYHLGNACLQYGDCQKAEIEYAKTIELGFKESSIYLDLARAQFQNKKYDDAVKSAQRAVELDTAYTEPYNLLADIYEKLGKTELRDAARQNAHALMNGEI
jgi:tetratricopeptide (TPR) repeat protein